MNGTRALPLPALVFAASSTRGRVPRRTIGRRPPRSLRGLNECAVELPAGSCTACSARPFTRRHGVFVSLKDVYRSLVQEILRPFTLGTMKEGPVWACHERPIGSLGARERIELTDDTIVFGAEILDDPVGLLEQAPCDLRRIKHIRLVVLLHFNDVRGDLLPK